MPSEHCTPEEVAEARRLAEELEEVKDSLWEKELEFVTGICDKALRFGDAIHISKAQFDWLKRIYERVL